MLEALTLFCGIVVLAFIGAFLGAGLAILLEKLGYLF